MALSGCAALSELPGEELIVSARDWYRSLDSAKVEVINADTGEAEQTFIFMYDEKDVMTYSYVGVSDGIYLSQYNNGYEQFTNDNGSVSSLTTSDLSFTAYSRDVPYPMADQGLLLLFKRAVIADSSSSEDTGSGTRIRYVYDPEKLGNYDGEGALSGFETVYEFDENGAFLSLTEITKVAMDDGSEMTHTYIVRISDINSVKKVENVVDISELSE